MKFSHKISYCHNINVKIILLHYQCNNILLISNVNIISLLLLILLSNIIKYVVFFLIFFLCLRQYFHGNVSYLVPLQE
jgi:hypothetical protein